jgi:uncharacterized membrane protein HdeD (DUF308 family)
MSNGETAFVPEEHFGELGKRWKWLLGFGILTVVLGLIGLGMATFLTLASVVFYGVILLADGVVQFVQSFQSAGWKAKLWHILISLLYVFGGVIVIRNPILASSILTLMLAGAITAIGLMRIVMAVKMKGALGWAWVLIGGILALLLGIMIFAKWPASSLIVIGTFISIELIINGWSAITVALAAKQAVKST